MSGTHKRGGWVWPKREGRVDNVAKKSSICGGDLRFFRGEIRFVAGTVGRTWLLDSSGLERQCCPIIYQLYYNASPLWCPLFSSVKWRYKCLLLGNSLVVQWLGFWVFTAGAWCSTPVQGTKILQAMQCSQRGKKAYFLKVLFRFQ